MFCITITSASGQIFGVLRSILILQDRHGRLTSARTVAAIVLLTTAPDLEEFYAGADYGDKLQYL